MTVVATSDWPARFPKRKREVSISEQLCQNVDDTNKRMKQRLKQMRGFGHENCFGNVVWLVWT